MCSLKWLACFSFLCVVFYGYCDSGLRVSVSKQNIRHFDQSSAEESSSESHENSKEDIQNDQPPPQPALPIKLTHEEYETLSGVAKINMSNLPTQKSVYGVRIWHSNKGLADYSSQNMVMDLPTIYTRGRIQLFVSLFDEGRECAKKNIMEIGSIPVGDRTRARSPLNWLQWCSKYKSCYIYLDWHSRCDDHDNHPRSDDEQSHHEHRQNQCQQHNHHCQNPIPSKDLPHPERPITNPPPKAQSPYTMNPPATYLPYTTKKPATTKLPTPSTTLSTNSANDSVIPSTGLVPVDVKETKNVHGAQAPSIASGSEASVKQNDPNLYYYIGAGVVILVLALIAILLISRKNTKKTLMTTPILDEQTAEAKVSGAENTHHLYAHQPLYADLDLASLPQSNRTPVKDDAMYAQIADANTVLYAQLDLEQGSEYPKMEETTYAEIKKL